MYPGQPYVIKINELEGTDYIVGGKEFSKIKDYYFFSPGLSLDTDSYFSAKLANESSLFSWPRLTYLIMPIKILHKKNMKASKLRIPENVWAKITTNTDKKKALDRKKMAQAYELPTKDIALQCWKIPLPSKHVSLFASPRKLPNGRRYYHTGLDFRAHTGRPIPVTADGEVFIAEHMVLPGNTVLISHGSQFYSRYMHLSEIKVKPGDFVKRGQIIGLAGATGRVEAPHLHWEILWKGNHVDPLRFLQVWEQICDPK